MTRNSYAYVNGDPINLFDPTGHGWDWWHKAKDFLAGGAKQVGGVVKGFGEAIVETGKGIGQLAWSGVALTGLRGTEAFNQTWNSVTTLKDAIKQDPWGVGKAIASSFADGIRNDWSHGNYGEAIGRGLFEVIGSLLGGGVVAKVTKLDKVASVSRVMNWVGNVPSKLGFSATHADDGKFTDEFVDLYHGTSSAAAEGIRQNGIDHARRGPRPPGRPGRAVGTGGGVGRPRRVQRAAVVVRGPEADHGGARSAPRVPSSTTATSGRSATRSTA